MSSAVKKIIKTGPRASVARDESSRKTIISPTKYAPEKVLYDSPVREENFAKIIEKIKETLTPDQSTLLEAVYRGKKGEFYEAIKNFDKNNIDFLSEHIKGFNLIHVAAARSHGSGVTPNDTKAIIDKLVELELNPTSLAEFTVDVDGNKENLSMSPIFFTNKTYEEDPNKTSKLIMEKLISFSKKHQDNLGFGFTSLAHEIASTGRIDLYKLLRQNKIVSPYDEDPERMNLGEFLADNREYFSDIHQSNEFKRAYSDFINIKNESKSQKAAPLDFIYEKQKMRIGYEAYRRLGQNSRILYTEHITEPKGAFLAVLFPTDEQWNQKRTENNEIPETAICSLLFSCKEAAEEIRFGENVRYFISKSFSADRPKREQEKLFLAIKESLGGFLDSRITTGSKYISSDVKSAIKRKYHPSNDIFSDFIADVRSNFAGKFPKGLGEPNPCIYQNDNQIIISEIPNDRTIEQLIVSTLHTAGDIARKLYPISTESFLSLCSEICPRISPIINSYFQAQSSLEQLPDKLSINPDELFSKINKSALQAIKDCENPETLAKQVAKDKQPNLLIGVTAEEIGLWKQLLDTKHLQDIYDYAGPRMRDKLYRAFAYSPDLDMRSIVVPEKDNPALMIVGGASTAGKSTLTRLLQGVSRNENLPKKEQVARNTLRITPKDVLRTLRDEGNPINGEGRHPEKQPENKDKYYNKLNEMVCNYLAQGKSVAVDDHCDNVEAIKSLLEQAKQECPHLATSLVGITLDYDTRLKFLQKARITNYLGRVINDKQAEYDFVEKTTNDFRDNLDSLTKLFDLSILYQNHENIKEAKPIAAWSKTSDGVSENIIYPEEYEIFKQGFSASANVNRARAG